MVPLDPAGTSSYGVLGAQFPVPPSHMRATAGDKFSTVICSVVRSMRRMRPMMPPGRHVKGLFGKVRHLIERVARLRPDWLDYHSRKLAEAR